MNQDNQVMVAFAANGRLMTAIQKVLHEQREKVRSFFRCGGIFTRPTVRDERFDPYCQWP